MLQNHYQHRPNVVPVMGIAGVGKSTLIKYATGLDVEVGHGQNCCTQKVAIYPIAGENTVLADTPGFDDTFRNDADILQDLNNCLSATFRARWNIAGVLYVHPITEPRMKGSAMKNLRIFREILGSKNMSNCILVTTKWSLQDSSVSEAREEELMEGRQFWKPLLESGASVMRFADTKTSALEIVHQLTRKAPTLPKMTHETQNLHTALADTDAGRVVEEGLQKAKEAYLREVEELKAQQAIAIIELKEDLRIERQRAEDALRQVTQQQDVLRQKSTVKKGIKTFFAVLGGSAMVTASIAATILTDGLAAGTIPVACGAYAALVANAVEDD